MQTQTEKLTPKIKYLSEKIYASEQTIKFQNLNSSLTVGIVDIVNSTLISSRLNNIDTAKYYTIFLNAMTRIIHEHDGIIVKNIGDSLLYFFEGNVNDKEHNTLPLECGVTLLECKNIINKILSEERLPKIQYRVSSEFGNVMVATTNTVMNVDVFGPTVNYCAKINKLAEPDEFVIGNDLKTIIGKIDRFNIKEKSFYETSLKNNFPIHSVRRS